MSGFIYNGQSTDTILDSVELILVSYDQISSITGITRENVAGNATITKPIAAQYGTTATPLSFQYGLIKRNGDYFTEQEQVAVERWLTSPKHSHDLVLTECDGTSKAIYSGLFTATEWYPHGQGYSGLTFTFQNDSAYAKRYFSREYTVLDGDSFDLQCLSDELEEYVYPKITINADDSTSTVIITNISDQYSRMSVKTVNQKDIYVDCYHNLILNADTRKAVKYVDIGWDDASNISWLRLLPGDNTLKVNGDCKITVSFEYPYKKVGGWI